MDLIKKEVMKAKESQHHYLHTNSSVSTSQSSTTARFDDVLINEVLDKLTGQERGLQIIPIVGMGGIGKTTLALNIYKKPLITQHFDIRAWVTISQEYSRGNVLKALCEEVIGRINGLSEMSEDELGERVYKKLWGRRFLIVMDDVWSIEAYDSVKFFFPNKCGSGSRILITTRLSNLAFELSGSHGFRMQFLDENKSWDLLCEIVFGKLDCPVELEDIGKEIARNCRGLPLSIVVIGGLLAKSNMTRVYWEYSLNHLNSLINLEDNEYCLQVLLRSYKELPIHLKPCFLYMGIFPEDSEINVSMLIKLWVSEGILKPNDGKNLEEVAEEYLKELIERNLILVQKLRWNGEAKICKIHDLLRDVSSREAKKQKFLCVVRQQKHHMEHSICIVQDNLREKYSPEIWEMPLLRHVKLSKFVLPDPPNRDDNFVLENLQTLSRITNFEFSDEAVKRIPNVKKLKVKYKRVDGGEGLPNVHLNNVGRLQKLESFNLDVVLLDRCDKEIIRSSLVSFPHSLKKLSLRGTELRWEELTRRIGSLPLLQVLRLSVGACTGPEWETVEGQFCSLRVLQIEGCYGLKYWNTDSDHFPRLEHLLLHFLDELEEIPSSIGDIPTLMSISLEYCCKSVKDSAKRIKEEQVENGNEDLQVIIDLPKRIRKEQRENGNKDLYVYTDPERGTYGEEEIYLDEEDEEDEDFDSDKEEEKVVSDILSLFMKSMHHFLHVV